ncbi:helix-turn-helix domain-containing protein [Paraburkholderia sp. A1RI-2L]|uniref:helix-turn-helix domain-containing protein n=1 Tax=Paraburkholderia sp. A1RI-2L TaxID=3028367 RepID=UPI003B7F7C1A
MAMDIKSLGKLVSERRRTLGLTQQRLARMAQQSPRAIQTLEAGTNDLGFERVAKVMEVLGLAFVPTPNKPKRALWMAAKNASVSYRGELTQEMLERTLATAEVPSGFEAHVGHFLDESPLDYVVMAVQEAAQQEHRPPTEIWANVTKLAQRHSITRKELWA